MAVAVLRSNNATDLTVSRITSCDPFSAKTMRHKLPSLYALPQSDLKCLIDMLS